jgi:hypothetical protein
VLRSCDVCGSRIGVKVYTDKPTGVSFRACWRRQHRKSARLSLARRAAYLRGRR